MYCCNYLPVINHYAQLRQINSDRSRQTGGTGLGLAIARAIAHKHQAILKVESQLQRGSIFILEMSMLNFDGGFIYS
ncbi:hypothetical protein FHK94_00650 [Cylindrospermopsis raciborskii CS-506_D]|uniref:histidine kinase n=1 Tax=Cylindrospermopsis raciborskii CS-506_A TaxID=2585140 RepID=A0A838WQR3_9CYAN|nr:hypothetical protein [Cylindrospermopsis raciborskii CS-506_C]MBA4448510.1 hypothetical protein [Cylindrospermopsis raciborskii CS-506_D]MBA4455136.1 hypothetical protein [Cylindrospermopsis raciborskii CS-506_B]MBA4464479.1 hypothetical protein [Cylindrospermopsis raciborskii CS-506_A]